MAAIFNMRENTRIMEEKFTLFVTLYKNITHSTQNAKKTNEPNV